MARIVLENVDNTEKPSFEKKNLLKEVRGIFRKDSQNVDYLREKIEALGLTIVLNYSETLEVKNLRKAMSDFLYTIDEKDRRGIRMTNAERDEVESVLDGDKEDDRFAHVFRKYG